LEHFQEKHTPGLIGVEAGFPSENATKQKMEAVSVSSRCETAAVGARRCRVFDQVMSDQFMPDQFMFD
jgi:hypothetical protein